MGIYPSPFYAALLCNSINRIAEAKPQDIVVNAAQLAYVSKSIPGHDLAHHALLILIQICVGNLPVQVDEKAKYLLAVLHRVKLQPVADEFRNDPFFG